MSVSAAGAQSAFIADSLLGTNPGFQYHAIEPPKVKTTTKAGVELVIITAVIFVVVITWFEVLRSWFDNVFTDQSNYRATWIRVLYATVVTILAVFLVSFFGKEVFELV